MNDHAETEVPEKSSGEAQRILLMVALGVLVLDFYLLVGVVPKFKAMFDALKGELPALSQWVLHFSWLMQSWLIPLVLVVGIGSWMAYRYAARIPLVVHVGVVVFLVGVMVLIPVAIFYPILQLQSAVRGEQPAEKPADPR